jgi:hypothetical protein
MPLEDYFHGDDGFHLFAVTCEHTWRKCPNQQRLLSAVVGNLDIAMACYHHLGDGAFEWLESAVPALDGLTPNECLKTEKLRNRLKECLWRMP